METLNSLLNIYERKRVKAQINAENKKQALYVNCPELKKIDTGINTLSVSYAKSFLTKDGSNINQISENIDKLKSKKLELLHKQNLTLDDLQPQYECKICNDTGFITDKNYKSEMCSCLKQKILNELYNKSNIYNLKNENFDKFNINIFSDKADKIKYNQSNSPRKNISIIKEKSELFIKNFDNPNQKNLLFIGNTGLRKNIYV